MTVFAIFQCSKPDDPETRAEQNCNDGGAAFVMSQEFIERKLRAPAAASFPWGPSSDGVKVVKVADCKFRVVAYVDAQNGFGANIRTVYTMILRYDPGDDTWNASDIVMAPR